MSGTWVALCGVDVGCRFDLRQQGASIIGRYGHENVVGTYWVGGVEGSVSGTAVHLAWDENASHATFDGMLSSDSVAGTLKSSPTSASVPFTIFRK